MEQTVKVNGVEIFVKDVGQGVPMLMLHGSPDTAEMWNPLIERLKDQVRCIAIDLPGFGRSTMPADFSLSVDHMADFVHALLDELGIQEPIRILSADFGTHYAQAFLVKYPQRVRGVVVSNSTFHSDYHWHGFAKLYRIPVLGEMIIATPKSMLKSTLKQYAPALPESYVDESYSLGFGSAKVRKAILRMYRERNPSKDFVGWDEKSKALMQEKPSLVLWGDRDPFADSTFADKFGAKQVVHFKDYSHWLPLEAPDAYAEKLIPWLATA